MRVFEVNDGELIDSLTEQARERGIADAAIVALIGGVDSVAVSTMPADDPTRDVITTYDVPAETHGSGEIKDGVVRIHATMAVGGDRAVSGHLHRAQVDTWFVRADVIPC
ncbi:PCC domain-containing protein [Streptoalloteichus tenebrarius]|uniref:PCC domain-containing protein n=1 Tax=Streptoalloteichus tenebrarius (strain ATCC 17920 / DSM 40477 / JCM 4838 / CBS 697.72 / NBRC 16177 / NCIMB 11028 / NRRL B-12390 / A12253. 1 / ISP 5477) TaxID=1933 RepID=UPI0036D3D195